MSDAAEVEDDADEADEAEATQQTIWVLVLVIVGSVIIYFATLTSWVERQALDTDAFVDITDQLLDDDEISEALATYLVDELYEAVAVDEVVADALPPEFEDLAPMIASALRGPSVAAVDRLLETDVVREAWSISSREAHEAFVAVIEDDIGEALTTADGAVTLDLSAILRALGLEIGLSDEQLDVLPEGTGVVVLFESDELATLQTALKVSKRLGTMLLIVVFASFGGALYLARDRRRETLRDCGIGIIVAAVLVLVTREVGSDWVVDALRRSSDEEPAKSVVEISSSLLRQVALTELIVGVTLVAFSVASGPTQLARRFRARLAPALRQGPAAVVVGGLVVFLALLWLKPGGPIDGWLIALGSAASCVAGVAWVQRVTLAERMDVEPDATTMRQP